MHRKNVCDGSGRFLSMRQESYMDEIKFAAEIR